MVKCKKENQNLEIKTYCSHESNIKIYFLGNSELGLQGTFEKIKLA